MKKKALLSVSDKRGIITFAKELIMLGYEIISTGGTYQVLREHGLASNNISDITQFPEILDGRVKTLHPNVHGGILARREDEHHSVQLQQHKIEYIDLVVVNLYPFKETMNQPGVTHEEVIENIDIGGPAMLRSAAKNYQNVTAIVDHGDYDIVLKELKRKGKTSIELRQRLAAKVYQITSAYDALIASYFAQVTGEKFPDKLTLTYQKESDLRYGENPQQQAAFYRSIFDVPNSLAEANQLQGKPLSYNNIQDAHVAVELVLSFSNPAVVALKHMNPCGVGIGNHLLEAWEKAYAADPISIFGGIIAMNQVVTEAVARKMRSLFLEVVIAPKFSEAAQEILATKTNLRLLELPLKNAEFNCEYEVKSVRGGMLVQTMDQEGVDMKQLKVVTQKKPTATELENLLFAWKVVKHVKSNAIVLASDLQTIGIGAGQMNRVGAAKLAIEQAKQAAKGSVMASDAFFPMADTIELAAKAGVSAIIQPGGSIKDNDIIAAADACGIAMILTHRRHFKH